MRVTSVQNIANYKAINSCRQVQEQETKTDASLNSTVLPNYAFYCVFGYQKIPTLIVDLEKRKYYSYTDKKAAAAALKNVGPVNMTEFEEGKLVNNRYFAVVAKRITGPDGKLDKKMLSEAVSAAKERTKQKKPLLFEAFYLINEKDTIRCETPEDGAAVLKMKVGDFKGRLAQNAKTVGSYAVVPAAELLDKDGNIDENKLNKARELVLQRSRKKPSSKIPVYVFVLGKEPKRFDSISKAAFDLDVNSSTVKKAVDEGGYLRRNTIVLPASSVEDEEGKPVQDKMDEIREILKERCEKR